jgi:hypothetical protein
MRRLTWLAVALLAAATTGCQAPARRTLTPSEPALTAVPGDSTIVAAKPAAPSDSVVDRHPLLSRPRDYYETTNSNKAVKTAAAVVVGVPAGIFGELRQIVRGSPPPPAGY